MGRLAKKTLPDGMETTYACNEEGFFSELVHSLTRPYHNMRMMTDAEKNRMLYPIDLIYRKVIQQLYYNKTTSDNRYGIVLIIPFSHNVNPEGHFCINGQPVETKIESKYGYVWEYDIYYDNVMAYEELTYLLNTLGYDVIRFQFSPDNMTEVIETFCMEIKNIVEKLNSNNILLLGHGVRGCIEAEILSTYIEASGMILLCGAAMEILDSIRQRFTNEYNRKLWIEYSHTREHKKLIRNLDKLPVSNECSACNFDYICPKSVGL